jgi:parallel beta-helix repeat protein
MYISINLLWSWISNSEIHDEKRKEVKMREYMKKVILFMVFTVIVCVSVSGAVSATDSPSANFTSNVTSGGAPLNVHFNDTSTGNATSWIWSFGDGGTSTEQNATHVYANEGNYNVSLTAINEAGTNTLTKNSYIQVYNRPVSCFTANTAWGTVPGAVPAVYNDVQFNDTSANVPTSWYWDFGDGTNSTLQNPTHAYTKVGNYKVSLTASNPAGNSTYMNNIQVLSTISVNNTLASGTYKTKQAVTLKSDNSTSTIYYTNDATDPKKSSTRVKYSGPITISKTTTLRYAAVTPMGKWSQLYVQNYVIGTTGNANLKNTGLSNYTGPEVNTTLWKYTTGGSISGWSSPVIGSDGTVYVGSGDGKVYALNPDGSVKWIYATGMYNKVGAINSLISGADGTIYAVSGYYDNRLYALNVDGTLKWNYKAPGSIYTPKVGADGTIYLGCTDGKLYALHPNGTVKWTYDTGTYIYSQGRGPAIGSDGTIYVESVESYSKGGNLYALNPDGTLKWKYTIGGNLQGSPTVGADGTIYVGGVDAKLYAFSPDGTLKWTYNTGETTYNPSIYGSAIGADGTIYFGSSSGNFYALNADGTFKWVYVIGESIYAAPTVGTDGNIYVGSSDGKLYAFSPDGTLLWNYTTGGAIYGAVAIGPNETLYFGSSDKNVYALANTVCRANQTQIASHGAVQFTGSGISPVSWYWNFGDGTHSTDQNPVHTYDYPGCYDVTLVVTSSNGQKRTMSFKQYIKVYSEPMSCFTATTSWGSIPGASAAVYNDIRFRDVSGYVPTSWYWDFGDGTYSTEENPTHVYTSMGIYRVTLTVTNPAGSDTFSCNIPVLGTISANSTLANGTYTKPQTVTLTSDDPKATIYYTNDTTDPRTSSTRIKYTGKFSISKTTTLRYAAVTYIGKWSPVYVQNYVIGTGGLADSPSSTYQDDNNHTGQSDYTGPQTNNTKWNNSEIVSVQDNEVSVGLDGTIYSGSSNGYLYALYPTGIIKWRYYTGGAGHVTTPTLGKDGNIYIVANGYLQAVTTNGTLNWKFYVDDNNCWVSPSIGADGTIYVGSYDNSGFLEPALYAINPNGTLKWSTILDKAELLEGYMAIGSDGTIYVPTHKVIYAVNPDGTIKWVYALGYHAIFVSPSIGPDGTIYLGGSDKALYALNPDGTLKWKYATKTRVSGTPSIGADGTIYILNSGYLIAINPDGTQKWNCTVKGSSYSSVIGADGTIYCGLFAVSSNGEPKWNFTGISATGNPVIDSDGTLYIGTSKGLYAFRDVAAKFNYTVDSNPLAVQFNDTSNNATSWTWDFGDGTTSALQNPAHTYAKSGQYLVTLKALTSDGVLEAAQMLTIGDITSPTVTISPNGGDFSTTQTVTLNATDDSGNQTLYYTTDGSDPRTSSTRHVYAGPITISTTTTLSYAAVDSSGNWSPVYDEIYTKSGDVQGVVIYVQDASYYTSGSLNDQIQTILDNAAPGTTIKFLGQNYENLHLVLNKQLKIISEVGTRISASDSSAVFLINGTQASGSTIKGFTIINTGSGIVVNNTKNVTISNDELSSTSGTAILVNGSSNTTIRSSSIHDSVTGVSVSGSNGTQVNTSNIYSNKDGVVIENSESTSTSKNQITGNSKNGISVKNSNKTTIKDNTVKNNGNTSTSGSGIYLENSRNININSNQINENFYGITANNITNATISNSKFLNNARDGILLNGIVKNITISSNTLQKNDNGIGINCASEHLTIRANLITDNQYKVNMQRMYHGNGIFLGENYASSSTFLVEHNVIRQNADMDFRSCQAAGTYIPGSNWYGTGCKQVTYDPQMTMAILKTGKNAFTVLFYDGLTGKIVTDLPSIAITIMNGAYSQTVMTTNGMATAIFESLANGDVVGSAYGITVSTAYNSIITALGGSNNGGSDPGKTNNDPGNGQGSGSNTGSGSGSGTSGSSSGSGSSASGLSSSAGATAASAAAGSDGQSGSCGKGDCQSDSKTVQELLVNETKKPQVWGVIGVILLIILVLGAYYRKDIMNMIRKSKK